MRKVDLENLTLTGYTESKWNKQNDNLHKLMTEHEMGGDDEQTNPY